MEAERQFAEYAGVAQLVEHQPSKLRVAGSSPVARLNRMRTVARVAQSVERVLGKDEVTGSIPVASLQSRRARCRETRSFSSAPSAGTGTSSQTKNKPEASGARRVRGSTARAATSTGRTRSRSNHGRARRARREQGRSLWVHETVGFLARGPRRRCDKVTWPTAAGADQGHADDRRCCRIVLGIAIGLHGLAAPEDSGGRRRARWRGKRRWNTAGTRSRPPPGTRTRSGASCSGGSRTIRGRPTPS